jgi:abhydrolase domain-containing protein 12
VVVHRFDTLQAVPVSTHCLNRSYVDCHQNITAPVLIAHAENDWDIPDTHSDILFQAFLDPILPPVEIPKDPLLMNHESWKDFTEQHARRMEALDNVLRTTSIPKFGRMDEFDDGERKIVLVKTLAGGHDYLPSQEGLVDIIGKNFGFI